MKKYLLIAVASCTPFLLWAQKTDTVAKKLADLPYIKCEIRPEFMGGKIDEYILKNFNRPENLRGNFYADVVVSLLIDSFGKPVKVDLIKSQSSEIDLETVRVLSATEWKPAIYDFKHVNYNMVFHLWIKNDTVKNLFKVDTYPNYKIQPIILKKSGDSTNKVYTSIETEPVFPGGIEAFSDFLSKNLAYPKNARQHNVQGKVFIQFVVEKDGSLTDLLVLRNPNEELSLEALRVLKICPRFKPGIQDGRPVRVYYTVPISFSLKR